MKSVETVSVVRNGNNWEHVTQQTNDDDSTTLCLHIIPDVAFVNYAKHFDEKDPEKVLDLVLHAPYVEEQTREAYDDVIARLKPETKTPHARMTRSCVDCGIDEKYHPNGKDPRETLLGAARKGIAHAEVQQAVGSPTRRPDGRDSVDRSSEQRRDGVDAGVADRTRIVPASGIRRVVARERFADGGADQAGA